MRTVAPGELSGAPPGAFSYTSGTWAASARPGQPSLVTSAAPNAATAANHPRRASRSGSGVAAALTLGLVCCRVGSVMANLRGGTGSPHPPVTPGVSGGHPRAREKDLTTLERVAGRLALPQP